ncbi:MAG: cytochrome c biogenesis protein ResB [Bdellovibrionales bacterium]|nr:cytochrome c biogenesis protein ResB [Bdellovibrionales bacterium]
MRKKLRALFLFFASLKLAVFVLLGTATVLAVGTVVESMYGMRAAHLMVYGTWWFGGILFLLGVNVLCAALSRYPWKPHQTGFVVTHAGILVILLGSVITQRFGVDGNLPVVEKDVNDAIALSDLKFVITNELSEQRKELPVPETGRPSHGNLMSVQVSPNHIVEIDTFYPRALFTETWEKSPVPGLGYPVVSLLLESSRFNVEQQLVAESPSGPTEFEMGPAIFSFQKLWDKKEEARFLNPIAKKETGEKEKGTVLIVLSGREYRLPINGLLGGWVDLGSTGHKIRATKYYTHAIVQENELVNKSSALINPAVRLEVRSKDGNLEHHTLFANFPEFPTLHRKLSGKNTVDGLKARMIAPRQRAEMGIVGRQRGVLRIAQSADDKKLLYVVQSRDGSVNGKGELPLNTPIETGWMDAKFTVLDWKPAAVRSVEPKPVDRIPDASTPYISALRYHIRDLASGTTSAPRWLYQGDLQRETLSNQRLVFSLTKDRLLLPFKVRLEKFMIGTDPGTTKAASYASDVTVLDSTTPRNGPVHISMNEPMEHAGFTFYQASYQKEEGKPTISVFSVNRDPGRLLKYLGSILLVLGISVMFYMNPHYFDILLGKKK